MSNELQLSEVFGGDTREFTNWARAVVNKKELTEGQLAISQDMNKLGKLIADSGVGSAELSQYIRRVVEEEVYNQPSELLDYMFTQGEIGEFDDYGSQGSWKNTLIAHESAPRGGSVDKSYVTFNASKTGSAHLQIETEIRYDDLRRDGALTIAQLTMYAIEALQNKKFQIIFAKINEGLISGDNVFTGSGLTVPMMDNFAGYLQDYSTSGNTLMVGLSNTLRGIKNMPDFDKFLSSDMKNELNMGCNILDTYGGVRVSQVRAGKKLADGTPLLPEKTIFGFTDKIGICNMRGDLRVYQTPNNQKEILELKFTGYEFVYSIDYPERIAKLKIS